MYSAPSGVEAPHPHSAGGGAREVEGGIVGANEKRSPFLQLPLPVSFRCMERFDTTEYPTEVVSTFQNGFVISSPRRLGTGATVLLTLQIPLSDGDFRRMQCPGRVVSQQTLKDGKVGYKVEIEGADFHV